MLAALEHHKGMQTQQQELLEKEIVRQREERARLEGIFRSVRRDHDDVKKRSKHSQRNSNKL